MQQPSYPSACAHVFGVPPPTLPLEDELDALLEDALLEDELLAVLLVDEVDDALLDALDELLDALLHWLLHDPP